MALTRTTLTAPITASQLTFGVASTANANFPAVGAAPMGYQPLLVDDEMMFLVSVPATNTVTVRMRGADGTNAGPHDLGSSVVTSPTPSDFPPIQPGQVILRPEYAPDIYTYGTTPAALAVPTEAYTIYYLASAAAGAFTLGAPSLALNGIILEITSQTGVAHVVTATGLYYSGLLAGSPFTTATFSTGIGSSMMLVAQNGSWNVANASTTAVAFS